MQGHGSQGLSHSAAQVKEEMLNLASQGGAYQRAGVGDLVTLEVPIDPNAGASAQRSSIDVLETAQAREEETSSSPHIQAARKAAEDAAMMDVEAAFRRALQDKKLRASGSQLSTTGRATNESIQQHSIPAISNVTPQMNVTPQKQEVTPLMGQKQELLKLLISTYTKSKRKSLSAAKSDTLKVLEVAAAQTSKETNVWLNACGMSRLSSTIPVVIPMLPTLMDRIHKNHER